MGFIVLTPKEYIALEGKPHKTGEDLTLPVNCDGYTKYLDGCSAMQHKCNQVDLAILDPKIAETRNIFSRCYYWMCRRIRGLTATKIARLRTCLKLRKRFVSALPARKCYNIELEEGDRVALLAEVAISANKRFVFSKADLSLIGRVNEANRKLLNSIDRAILTPGIAEKRGLWRRGYCRFQRWKSGLSHRQIEHMKTCMIIEQRLSKCVQESARRLSPLPFSDSSRPVAPESSLMDRFSVWAGETYDGWKWDVYDARQAAARRLQDEWDGCKELVSSWLG